MHDNEQNADEGLRQGETEVLGNVPTDIPANQGLYSEGSSHFYGGSEKEGGANTFDSSDEHSVHEKNTNKADDSGGGLSDALRRGMP